MNKQFSWESPVQFLKSVGPARARSLARLGIETVGDLLGHYPRRYFDRTSATPVGRLIVGKEATVEAEILTINERRTRRSGTIQTVAVGDGSGVLFCVWFNQRFLLKQFQQGRRVLLSGMVRRHQGKLQMAHPDFEIQEPGKGAEEQDSGARLHSGRLVPVYGLTSGVGQHWLRALVWQALERLEAAGAHSLPDPLPVEVRRRRRLPDLMPAVRQVHFPDDGAALAAALRRLVYQEFYLIQVLMARRRAGRLARPGVALSAPGDLTRRLVEGLPFALTGAQRRVLREILADLRAGQTMHRLLQGDVGSGKTLVAFIAALFVIEQGYQAMLMAPTEVLARQHGQNLQQLAGPLGVTVETLTGSTPSSLRRAVLAAVGAGETDLLVGTHALIQEGVRVPRLALSVVDEQHRFGVEQRVRSTGGSEVDQQPHVLVMSATPIPRSLSLTLYGDLDLSIIDELPPGRQPIITHLVPDSREQEVWDACRQEMNSGRQVYVVHPVIEETEGQDLKSAEGEFQRLAGEVFPEFQVALLHGKLKPALKNEIMTGFAAGDIDMLVATTVVEVGLDVASASVMVIHNPERFGLAQLHQLRGRVGRGGAASTCWLVADPQLGAEARGRLEFFAGTLDGFALAEEDLRLRGPGEAWGTRQHGAPGFRLANPLRDGELLQQARLDARQLLDDDPELKGDGGRRVQAGLAAVFGSHLPAHGSG
jgi:ATP-dependent DNA helicase RecG